ncbi:hypothetical protein GF327_02550 [Candidatus Woesearchaeota archaeon]|nr:hypothetical protein [Candidatus Woesearchaeota archaeon]
MIDIANPRQIVLVTCRAVVNNFGKQELKDNITTIIWHSPLSNEPKMYCISIHKQRFSHELLSKSKVFCVNFMDVNYESHVLFCKNNTGNNLDKFIATGLTKMEAQKIDCSLIKEASAHLECEIINEIETGDHILFLARVLNDKLYRKDKRIFHISGDEFSTII